MRNFLTLLSIIAVVFVGNSQTSLSPNSIIICSGQNVSVTASNPNASYTFIWSFGTSTQTSSTLSLTNVQLSQTWVCTTFDGTNQVDTDNLTITVNQTPTITSSLNLTACSGVSLNYNITSSTPSSFVWSANPSLNINGETVVNSMSTSIVDNLTNLVSTNQPVTYSIIPTSLTGNCIGLAQNVTVTVVPIPAITSANAYTVCSGSTMIYNITSNPINSSYSWVATNNSNISGESTTPTISSTINNVLTLSSTVSPELVTYSITPTSTLGSCVGLPSTLIVTVNPASVLAPNSGNNATCVNTSTSLSNSQAGGSWSSSNPSIATINPTTGLISALSSGSTTITYTYANSFNCTSTANTAFTVNALPTVNSPSSVSICSGGTLAYSITSNIPSTYSWVATNNVNVSGESLSPINTSIINNTLSSSGISNQTVSYSISPTSTNGSCIGTPFSLIVSVNPSPSITSTSASTICSGGTLAYSITSNIPSSYSWVATSNNNISGEGLTAISSNLINNQLTSSSLTAQIVNYTITPTSTLGSCVGAPFIFSVTVNPSPIITSASNSTICSGGTVAYSITSSIPSSYSWVAANNNNITGEGLTSVSSNLINNQLISSSLTVQDVNYTITPTSTLGSCIGAPFSFTVSVNPSPIITSSSTSTICSGGTLAYSITSSIPSSYSWVATNNTNVTGESLNLINSSNINNSLTSISLTAQNVIYTITPTSSIGTCIGAPFSFTATVNSLPVTTISSSGPLTFCSGSSVVLTAPFVASNNYHWTNNGVQIPGAFSNQLLVSNSGNYGVQIVDINNCTASNNALVFELDIPTALIYNNGSTNFICSGTEVNLLSEANCNNCSLFYSWYNNGNYIGSNSNLTTGSAGTYYLNITNTLNGVSCSDSSNSITISVVPVANPIFSNLPSEICGGDTFILPQLSDNYVSGLWSPAIISEQDTLYTFTPLSQCANSYSLPVEINSLPQVSLGNDTIICQNEILSLSLSGFDNYLWLNGSTDSSISITPFGSVNISVVVTDTNGCIGTDTTYIHVNPLPQAPYINGLQVLCSNALNQNYYTVPSNNLLFWEVQGGQIYSGQFTNEVHIDVVTQDTIFINLTEQIIATGCSSTTSLTVLVDPSMTAPGYVNVIPLGSQNDFLCAPQAANIFRWGKIDKQTNDIFFYETAELYYNFNNIDTAGFYYFVDHGQPNCFTRSYYVAPPITAEITDDIQSVYSLSPNPTIDAFKINSDLNELIQIQIQDIHGKIIFEGEIWTNSSFDFSTENPGIYFVSILSQTNKSKIKFLNL